MPSAAAKSRPLNLVKPSPRAKATKVPTLSIIIPLLNEAEILETSYRRVREEASRLGESFELIFVNDGSTDGSTQILDRISAGDPHVVVVHLSRNFGHELATSAGLRTARGRAAMILDADLQDPPELMAEFLRKWKEGYEVVYGVRRRREGETWLKKATSFLFYRLMASISDVPIPRNTGDFRLVDRRVVEVFNQLEENPRFFRGMISWIGFRQTGILFDRQPRIGGISKYRYTKLVRLAFDTITSFSMFPAQGVLLLAGVAIAATFFAMTLVAGFWALGSNWINTGSLGIWLLVMLANFNLISIAILGQYIVRTHRNTQKRPLFTIDALVKDGKRTTPDKK